VKRSLLLMIIAALIAPSLTAQQYLVKFATLAPEGTTPTKIMRDFDKAIRSRAVAAGIQDLRRRGGRGREDVVR